MVESFKGDLILTGGRGTGGIGFFNDVWRSSDGTSWWQMMHLKTFDHALIIIIPHFYSGQPRPNQRRGANVRTIFLWREVMDACSLWVVRHSPNSTMMFGSHAMGRTGNKWLQTHHGKPEPDLLQQCTMGLLSWLGDAITYRILVPRQSVGFSTTCGVPMTMDTRGRWPQNLQHGLADLVLDSSHSKTSYSWWLVSVASLQMFNWTKFGARPMEASLGLWLTKRPPSLPGLAMASWSPRAARTWFCSPDGLSCMTCGVPPTAPCGPRRARLYGTAMERRATISAASSISGPCSTKDNCSPLGDRARMKLSAKCTKTHGRCPIVHWVICDPWIDDVLVHDIDSWSNFYHMYARCTQGFQFSAQAQKFCENNPVYVLEGTDLKDLNRKIKQKWWYDHWKLCN